MIVHKNIELEIKFLKDYPDWEFLPEEDLKRKSIEIFFDLKSAKRACNKEQKLLKFLIQMYLELLLLFLFQEVYQES